MKKYFKHILFVVLVVTLASCATLQEALNMANCKYKLDNITNIIWGNVNLSKIKKVSDLSVADAAKLAKAIINKDYNIQFTTNIAAQNNTALAAALSGFDYILQLNGNDIASGEHNKAVSIPANSSKTIPLTLKVDAKNLFSKGTLEDMVDLAKNISNYGEGNASNVGLKIRPWITNAVTGGSTKLTYINLNKTFQ